MVAGKGLSTAEDAIKLHPQCVLYSEIDNVTSVNKGWDVGQGVGWLLNYPYAADGSVPPTGIRSSVPLGGMGTGNFELRGDGTFRQWCIESQSPGGGAKLDIGALDEAVLGVRVGNTAALLRTRPPAGLPGVKALEYEGAVPVSKLSIRDQRFPVEMSLYAHGKILPWQPNVSMTPAVAFTLTVANPTAEPLKVSLLLSMPLAAQPETDRIQHVAGSLRIPVNDPSITTVAACKSACDAAAACSAWVFDQAATGAKCFMIEGGVPQNVYHAGVVSGIKGKWGVSNAQPRSLVHERTPSTAKGLFQPPFKANCSTVSGTPNVDIGGGAILGDVSVVAEGQAGYKHVCCCLLTQTTL